LTIWGEDIEQGEVESGVDADQIASLADVSPDVGADFLLVGVDLAEGEKVLFADALCVLAHGVAEGHGEVALDVHERVDAVAVDVEPAYHVRVAVDKCVPDEVMSCSIL
jgi:hypothetical protein